MYSMIDHELGRERQKELLREARRHSLARTARRSTRRIRKADLAWELKRYGGKLRKLLRRA